MIFPAIDMVGTANVPFRVTVETVWLVLTIVPRPITSAVICLGADHHQPSATFAQVGTIVREFYSLLQLRRKRFISSEHVIHVSRRGGTRSHLSRSAGR